MKALFITCQTNPSAGSEDLWVKTAVRLTHEGHRIDVIVPNQWRGSEHELTMKNAGLRLENVSVDGNLFERALDRLRGLPRGKRLVGKPRLQRVVDASLSDADVVVVTQGGLHDVALVPQIANALLKSACPIVLNVRSGRGILGGVSALERELARGLFSKAQGVVVPTKANFADIELELCVRLGKKATIHSPLKNAAVGSQPWPTIDVVRFACPCRIEAVEKGLDLLIEAVSQLADHKVPFEVSVYGDGPDTQYIRQLIDYHGLEERVFLRGRYKDLADLWSSHHALLLPSRSEGMPQSLMEAMVAGRPSIATRVGGVGELVVDGVNGFVAKEASVAELVEAMGRCLDSHADLEKMGRAAAQTAREQLRSQPEQLFGDFIDTVVHRRIA